MSTDKKTGLQAMAGIILAAGRSRRMGACKAFLPWGDSTFVETIAANLRAAGAGPLLAVFRGDDFERAQNASGLKDFTIVRNDDECEEGPISSIRAAIRTLIPPDCLPAKAAIPLLPSAGADPDLCPGALIGSSAMICQGALICPVDHPAVRPGTFAAILSAAQANPGRIILPEYPGAGSPPRTGHPCWFPREVFADLFAVPEGQGAAWVLERNPGRALPLSVDDPGVLWNINTRQAYEESRREIESAARRQALE